MFDRLFRRKSPDPGQVDDVLGRLDHLLTDETRQNAIMPPEVRALLEAGPAVDEIRGAVGEFGRDARNPIPVNGPIGEALYLSSLAAREDQFIFAHRLGSLEKVDIFETVTSDGLEWDFLFLSLYHPRKSRKAPAGYRFRSQRQPPFVCATTILVPDFPHQMRQAISEWTRSTLGIPLVSREIREAIEQHEFTRPAKHAARLQALKVSGKTQPVSDDRIPLLIEHVESQSSVIAAVLNSNLGCAPFDRTEVVFFCAATACYAYRHYGRGAPDEAFLEGFGSALAADCAKRSMSFGTALQQYRLRSAEYGGLYDAMFEPGKDERHKRDWLVRVMMHLVERATGRTAEGYMVKISINAPVVAAVFDDAFKLARGRLNA